MRRPLDLARLHELCASPLPEVGGGAEAWRVVEEFGALADLWLRPEIVDRARAWRSQMNGEPAVAAAPARLSLARGETGLLLATENAVAYPRLRPAFVLPVEWRRVAHASLRLPGRLADYAASVLRDVGLSGLSLHLPDRLERRGGDLSALSFRYESAWAGLAASAIVVDQGGATLPDVLTSAAWNPERPGRGWIARVAGIPEKLDAAAAGGARVVLVPRENVKDVEAWRATRPNAKLDVQFLANAADQPARALAPVLHALEAMPTRKTGATFEQRTRYFTRMPQSGRERYHRDELLDDLVARLRPQIAADPVLAGIDRLALVASMSWSLAFLVVRLFDPAEVLLLHDGRLNDELRILLEDLPSAGRTGGPRVVVSAECRPGATFIEDVSAALARFAADAGRVVVDVTAGYKDFHFAILSHLPPNALAVYIATDQDARYSSAVPGTERVRVLTGPLVTGRLVAPDHVRPQA